VIYPRISKPLIDLRLTSPETLHCCLCMLTGQFRILTTNLSTDRYFHTVSNWGKSTVLQKTVPWRIQYCGYTVESGFHEPPRETQIGSKNRRVQEIRGRINTFDWGRETTSSSSYREVWKTEGSRNRDSTVNKECDNCVHASNDTKTKKQSPFYNSCTILCMSNKADCVLVWFFKVRWSWHNTSAALRWQQGYNGTRKAGSNWDYWLMVRPTDYWVFSLESPEQQFHTS